MAKVILLTILSFASLAAWAKPESFMVRVRQTCTVTGEGEQRLLDATRGRMSEADQMTRIFYRLQCVHRLVKAEVGEDISAPELGTDKRLSGIMTALSLYVGQFNQELQNEESHKSCYDLLGKAYYDCLLSSIAKVQREGPLLVALSLFISMTGANLDDRSNHQSLAQRLDAAESRIRSRIVQKRASELRERNLQAPAPQTTPGVVR